MLASSSSTRVSGAAGAAAGPPSPQAGVGAGPHLFEKGDHDGRHQVLVAGRGAHVDGVAGA